MKKTQFTILIVIAVAIIAAVAILSGVGNNDVQQQVTNTVVPEIPTEQVTDKETTTPDVTTTVVPEQPAQMVVDDATGKCYFVGKDSLKIALEGDIQWRLDSAIMDTYNVYDCRRAADQLVVNNDGKAITAVYGLNGLPESVTILRNGYGLLTFSEFEFKLEESYKNSFDPASDEKFTEVVYCDSHNAIKSVVNIAYRNAREFPSEGFCGFRGTFSTKKMDTKVFDAWVLVTRSIELNGEEVVAYTWVLNTCECGNQADGGNGGHVVVTPTAAPVPSQDPTAKPSAVPTKEPTQEPTQAPTPAPTGENNRPKPTGENNDMTPVQPTPKPATTPNGGEVPPTVRPSKSPDSGWHDELPPKVDDEF